MYSLGMRSKQRLGGVHPDLAKCVKLAITLTRQDFTVLEGVRSIEAQREYVRKGASQTMESRHLVGADGWGHAVDLAAWVQGTVRWEWELYPPIANAMRLAARELNLPIRYGGGWYRLDLLESQQDIVTTTNEYIHRRQAEGKRPFLDGPHFELPACASYPG